MTFVSGLFVGILIVMMVVRLRQRLASPGRRGLSDEQIRAIETRGEVELEDPLDLDTIRDEEARFWEESWDEPEEW